MPIPWRFPQGKGQTGTLKKCLFYIPRVSCTPLLPKAVPFSKEPPFGCRPCRQRRTRRAGRGFAAPSASVVRVFPPGGLSAVGGARPAARDASWSESVPFSGNRLLAVGGADSGEQREQGGFPDPRRGGVHPRPGVRNPVQKRTLRAARKAASKSASSWAKETMLASKADGARKMP